MHRQKHHLNIPTEIMRSIIAISESGSITKAANQLGLSQPAISAQVKRIEGIVGGNIFQKTPNGSVPTELGKMVLKQARRILEANDQLLFLRSPSSDHQTIRIGVSSLYTGKLLACLSKSDRALICMYADSSAEVAKGLASGFVDIGLFVLPADVPIDPSFEVVRECDQEMVWARSRDFVLSPGAPVPLVTWPGQLSHDLMTEALDRNGMVYRLAFTSPDMHAAIEAAAAGVGLMALVRENVPSSLMVANEYYLPPFKAIKLFLAVRASIQLRDRALIDRLSTKLFDCRTKLKPREIISS